jgi:putative ABC transport system permease protein
MNVLSIIKVALRALSRNKMRSALTMLGIIIGVGAVIAMVSIGQGAQRTVQSQIQSIGTNVVFVWPGSLNSNGVRLGAGASNSLTEGDVEAIERECPSVAAASAIVRSSTQIVFGDRNWFTQVQGTNEKFCRIRDWQVLWGDFFTAGDARTAARVIVLGRTVADNLFNGTNPIGQMVRIHNLPFRVIGVLDSKGQSAMGQDQDDVAIMPYTTVQKKLIGQTVPHINAIMMSCVSPDETSLAVLQTTGLLRQRHKIPAGQPDDFMVRNLTDIAETAEQTNQVMTLLLGSIAAVSLLVGGIGIMNIMLVSVTERTREIGIRMAIGARPGYIRMQFLAESMILSLLGGVVGVLGGIALSYGISSVLDWPTLVSAFSILISFGFAALVGIFFGFYPARKASALDPIDALRYE